MPDPPHTQSDNILIKVVTAGSLAAIILLLIGALYPSRWLWGTYHSATMPTGYVIIIAVFATIFCIPKINSYAVVAFNNMVNALARILSKSTPLTGSLALAAILVVAAFAFHTENHLMGDGYRILSGIFKENLFTTRAPLERILNTLIIHIFGITGSEGARWMFFATSTMAGILFIVSAYYFFRLVLKDMNKVVIGLLLVFTVPVIQLFLGYIENYPILHGWIAFFIYICTLKLRQRTSSATCIAVFIAGVGIHASFIVFFPVLLWVLLFSSGKMDDKRFFISAILFNTIIYIAGAMPTWKSFRLFLLPFPSSKTSYFLFSPGHLADIVNVFLLTLSILGFVFALMLYLRFRKRDKWDTTQKLLVYLSLSGLPFICFIDPAIGALRDWDLLALASTPMIFSAVYFILKRIQPGLRLASAALPILVVGLWHTGSWIYSNMDQKRAFDLMLKPLLNDTHYSKDYYNGIRLVPFAVVLANNLKDYPVAKGLIYHKLSIDSTDVAALDALQNIYRTCGDMNSAADILGKIVALRPDAINHKLTYAMTLFEAGRYKEAFPILKEVEYDTTGYRRDFYLGSCFIDFQQFDSALTYFNKIYEIEPTNEILNYKIGTAYAGLNDLDTALKYFRKALNASPYNAETLLRIGQVFQGMKEYDSAEVYLNRSLEIDPRKFETRSSLAFMYMETERFEESIKSWRECTLMKPQYFYGYFFIGKIQNELGKPQEALKMWNSTLEIFPGFIPALYQSALVYEKLGERDSVISRLSRIPQADTAAAKDTEIAKKLRQYNIRIP